MSEPDEDQVEAIAEGLTVVADQPPSSPGVSNWEDAERGTEEEEHSTPPDRDSVHNETQPLETQLSDAAARFAATALVCRKKLSRVDLLAEQLDEARQSIPKLDKESSDKWDTFFALCQESRRCSDLVQTGMLDKQKKVAMVESDKAELVVKMKKAEVGDLEQKLKVVRRELYNCYQACKHQKDVLDRLGESLWTYPGDDAVAELVQAED